MTKSVTTSQRGYLGRLERALAAERERRHQLEQEVQEAQNHHNTKIINNTAAGS